jgi:hypothetical protein
MIVEEFGEQGFGFEEVGEGRSLFDEELEQRGVGAGEIDSMEEKVAKSKGRIRAAV